jgi:hypothetical protein
MVGGGGWASIAAVAAVAAVAAMAIPLDPAAAAASAAALAALEAKFGISVVVVVGVGSGEYGTHLIFLHDARRTARTHGRTNARTIYI